MNIVKIKSRREEIIRIRKIILTIIIILLSVTVISSYLSYKNSRKKIEVKNSIRGFILATESVKVNDNIDFNDEETVTDIKISGGNKLEAIKKYVDMDSFDKIEGLTIGDANKIIKNEEDFEINSKGQFVKIK